MVRTGSGKPLAKLVMLFGFRYLIGKVCFFVV